MEIRTTKKIIELKGRTFILNKFDPFFGSFLAFKIFKNQSQGKGGLEEFLSEFFKDDFEEFKALQIKVLSYCSEKLISGEVPVINEENNIAIVNLTPSIMMNLFIQSLMYNLSDFFEEEATQETPQVEELL